MSTQGRGGCENKQLKNMSGLLFHNVFIHFNIQPGLEDLSTKISSLYVHISPRVTLVLGKGSVLAEIRVSSTLNFSILAKLVSLPTCMLVVFVRFVHDI